VKIGSSLGGWRWNAKLARSKLWRNVQDKTMGWYKRGSKRYYFQSERVGNTVTKHYVGCGPVADLAARADALKQYELEETRNRWKQDKPIIDEACRAFEELDSGCKLLRDAVLLTAGFFRPDRHSWRKWNHGRAKHKERIRNHPRAAEGTGG